MYIGLQLQLYFRRGRRVLNAFWVAKVIFFTNSVMSKGMFSHILSRPGVIFHSLLCHIYSGSNMTSVLPFPVCNQL